MPARRRALCRHANRERHLQPFEKPDFEATDRPRHYGRDENLAQARQNAPPSPRSRRANSAMSAGALARERGARNGFGSAEHRGERIMHGPRARTHFFGWRVVAAAFVLAVFGWGVGAMARRSSCMPCRSASLAADTGLGRRHRSFSRQRHRGREPAAPLSTIRPADDHQGGRHGTRFRACSDGRRHPSHGTSSWPRFSAVPDGLRWVAPP